VVHSISLRVYFQPHIKNSNAFLITRLSCVQKKRLCNSFAHWFFLELISKFKSSLKSVIFCTSACLPHSATLARHTDLDIALDMYSF
jgi:hypothetical protein